MTAKKIQTPAFDPAAFLAAFQTPESILSSKVTTGRCPGWGIDRLESDDPCGDKLGKNKDGKLYEICTVCNVYKTIFCCGYESCQQDVRGIYGPDELIDIDPAAKLVTDLFAADELPAHMIEMFMVKADGRPMPQGSPDLLLHEAFKRGDRVIKPMNWTHYSCYRERAARKESVNAYYTGADKN